MMSHRYQRGNIAPLMILILGGLLLTIAYVNDSSRMVSNSSQLKRATDAAALALGYERLNNEEGFADVRDELADQFVRANLGMDQQLLDTLQNVSVEETKNDQKNVLLTVQASFLSHQDLTGFDSQKINVLSTVEITREDLELSLILDSSASLASGFGVSADASLHAEATEYFVNQLFGEKGDGKYNDESDYLSISVVPFSDEVNLYDPQQSIDNQPRMHKWADVDALTPNRIDFELGDRGFFARYGDLTNVRFPDRRARRLSFYRGFDSVNRDFIWEPSPEQEPMEILASMMDTNAETGRPVVSERRYFVLTATDTLGRPHTIATGPGTPNTPLLPLSSKREEIIDTIRQIKGDWGQWPFSGLLWGASSLSPYWRGDAGWGDPKRPLDYNIEEDEHNHKAIVLFMKWSYGWSWEITDTSSYLNYCQELADRNIPFYAIVRVRDSAELSQETGSKASGHTVLPIAWLNACTNGGKNLQVFDTLASQKTLENGFDNILKDLARKKATVRLIK